MQLEKSDWPTFGWVTDMRPALRAARVAGRTVVLGTLVRIDGPSPRPLGSQMLFDGARAVGYFSGGCLESDVANHARHVLRDGAPRRLVYGQGSPWIDIRLLCGGTLEIALERIPPDDAAVHALLQLAERREPARWTSGRASRHVNPADPADPVMIDQGDGYTLRHDPPCRLLIVGRDPFVLAMASLATSAGIETTILSPDGPVTPPPLPDVDYRRDRVDNALTALAPDRWTAIVTATHDEDLDDAVLLTALRADAGYVGVLGSARRIGPRRSRFLEVGLTPDRIAALHAPIGAARCGKGPWEVAVSVLAEIMQAHTDWATFAASAGGFALREVQGRDMACTTPHYLIQASQNRLGIGANWAAPTQVEASVRAKF